MARTLTKGHKLSDEAIEMIEKAPVFKMRELEMITFSSDDMRRKLDEYERLFDEPELAMDQEYMIKNYRDIKESMLDFVDYVIWNNEQTNKKLDKILELLDK